MSVLSQFLARIRFKPEVITATAGQSIFTLSTISIPGPDQDSVILIINGKKQPNSAYTVDSSTQITTSEGLEDGDLLEVVIAGYK